MNFISRGALRTPASENRFSGVVALGALSGLSRDSGAGDLRSRGDRSDGVKVNVSFSGGMEGLIRTLCQDRGISEQEAVRALIGEAMEARRSHLQVTPVTSSHLQSPPALSRPESPPGDSSHLQVTPGDLPRARGEESLLLSSQRSIDSEEKTTKTTKPAPAAGFPEFWEAYPRKDGKKAAERAWTASAKSRPPLPDLLFSLSAQASARGWPSQYTPHAATWLNGERWNDPAAAPGGNGNGAAARRALGADDERMRQYANVGVEWTPEDL